MDSFFTELGQNVYDRWKQKNFDLSSFPGIAQQALQEHPPSDHVDLGTLIQVADALQTAGFEVELREPDGQDPLGGVVDIRGPFGLIQIVNYGGRFPAVIDGGLAAADTVIRSGSRLRIVPLPHLVALKLYAGGTKSRADIVELLARNPDADMAAIRDLCQGWRLRGLEPLIEEALGEP